MSLALCALVALVGAGTAAPPPAGITVEHLHVVIERHGDRLAVDQNWHLVGGGAEEARQLRLPLPAGAVAPLPSGPKDEPRAVALDGDAFRLTRSIPQQGLEAAFRFELPIVDGRASLRQRLPAPISRAEIVSTWTASDATLTVDGVGPGQPSQLANGLIALVVQAQGVERQLTIRLAGLEDPGSSVLPRATLVVCLVLLLVGFGVWLRRR